MWKQLYKHEAQERAPSLPPESLVVTTLWDTSARIASVPSTVAGAATTTATDSTTGPCLEQEPSVVSA